MRGYAAFLYFYINVNWLSLSFGVRVPHGRKCILALRTRAIPVCCVTLAWLGPICPGWGPSGPPGCCWWPARSCSRTPAGRPAGNLHPNQATGPWYTTAETPALPRSPDTPHPDGTQTTPGITLSKPGQVVSPLLFHQIYTYFEIHTSIKQLKFTLSISALKLHYNLHSFILYSCILKHFSFVWIQRRGAPCKSLRFECS